MKLEEQTHQIFDRGQIELINHQELLWENKQIIRLREEFFSKIQWLLESWKNVTLYNHYNPINIDLIRSYKEIFEEYNWAMIWKIIDRNNLWPILCWESLTKVKVQKMFNIDFEDIDDDDLIKSICDFQDKISVEKLIEWLSKEFYGWDMSETEIIKAKKLFFRQIVLHNK